jgi:hypothetical protein
MAGFHALEPKSKTDTPMTQTSFQGPSSSTSNEFSSTASATISPQPLVSGARGDDRFFNRMDRLRKLFDDLHLASVAAGGEDDSNPHVAEVRGRIAELVREESENSRPEGITLAGNIPPPAYEPT